MGWSLCFSLLSPSGTWESPGSRGGLTLGAGTLPAAQTGLPSSLSAHLWAPVPGPPSCPAPRVTALLAQRARHGGVAWCPPCPLPTPTPQLRPLSAGAYHRGRLQPPQTGEHSSSRAGTVFPTGRGRVAGKANSQGPAAVMGSFRARSRDTHPGCRGEGLGGPRGPAAPRGPPLRSKHSGGPLDDGPRSRLGTSQEHGGLFATVEGRSQAGRAPGPVSLSNRV